VGRKTTIVIPGNTFEILDIVVFLLRRKRVDKETVCDINRLPSSSFP
jgi:hypothetical protein